MADLIEGVAFAAAVVAVMLLASWRYDHESEERRKDMEKWEWRHKR